MTKVKPDDVTWVEAQVTKIHDNPPPESQWLYRIWLPDWLAEWDVFANWERERLQSMAANLKPGDILFDVGAENGWCSMVYAKLVGPENMVLIEPNPDFWPNIRNTWERNYPTAPPLACYPGFFSDETTGDFVGPKHAWPEESEGDLMKEVHYRYINQHADVISQFKLDDYVERTGIVPDALTIDVEGACLKVVAGAVKTLKNHNVKVWLSIHPDLMEKNFGAKAALLHTLLSNLGYRGEHLATDHEEHWYFSKEAK